MKIKWDEDGPNAADAVVVILVSLMLGAGLFLPVLSILRAIGYECTFRSLTGHPCATCGATRAVIEATGMSWVAALEHNPLITWIFLVGTFYAGYTVLAVVWNLPLPRLNCGTGWEKWGIAAGMILLIAANWIFLLCR